MSGLIESATAILNASERRLETIANNVSNATTPGFKRELSFVDALDSAPGAATTQVRTRADLAQGRLTDTGNSLDLAISGNGFFRLRDGETHVYSRQGQFRIDEDGRVVDAHGLTLQAADGGDLALGRTDVEILADGTVVADGLPTARIALYRPAEGASATPLPGSLFAIGEEAVEEASGAQLRQGMVEASNVAMADEMVGMMTALRQAESGARLVQVYDELVGRALTTFGGSGR